MTIDLEIGLGIIVVIGLLPIIIAVIKDTFNNEK